MNPGGLTGLLVAAFLLQGIIGIRGKSPTFEVRGAGERSGPGDVLGAPSLPHAGRFVGRAANPTILGHGYLATLDVGLAAFTLLFFFTLWRYLQAGEGAARGCVGLMLAIAILVVQALYLSPGGVSLYSLGMQRVNADHNPDYLVFLAGQFQHSFVTNFPMAYLLKEPIAAILRAGIGVWAMRRELASRPRSPSRIRRPASTRSAPILSRAGGPNG